MENLKISWTTSSWEYVENKVIKKEKVEVATFLFAQVSDLTVAKKDSFVVVFDKNINSKDELLRTFKDDLKFPYFGNNWDALLDCLRNLDWINNNDIVIYHEEIPNLNEKDLDTYIEILCYAVSAWREDSSKSFSIYFNNNDIFNVKVLVERSLKSEHLISSELFW